MQFSLFVSNTGPFSFLVWNFSEKEEVRQQQSHESRTKQQVQEHLSNTPYDLMYFTNLTYWLPNRPHYLTYYQSALPY